MTLICGWDEPTAEAWGQVLMTMKVLNDAEAFVKG